MSETNIDWYEWGKKMKIIAIFTIIIFIPFVGLIFSILALTHIRNINSKLNNPLLEDFHSKWLSALIIRIIGVVVGFIGWPFPFFSVLYFTFAGIGWILAIIAGAIEMGAWGSLETFFRQNTTMFPANISRDAEEGSHYLRNAALMYILSFLIIPAIIGWIFSIIGYFKLATMELITDSPAPITQPTSSKEPTTIPDSASLKFCPNCGADVTGAGKFCGACGSPLT